MAYDISLADRTRSLIEDEPGLDERRMFGSVVFLINGHMACGVSGENLIVRTGPDLHAAALTLPGCREFDLSGRPMNNWVLVDATVLDDDEDLQRWSRMGVEFAQSLPPK